MEAMREVCGGCVGVCEIPYWYGEKKERKKAEAES